jgi:hypothetical protein
LSKINEQEYFKSKDQSSVDAERRITLKSRDEETSSLKFEID